MSENIDTGEFAGLMLAAPDVKMTTKKRTGTKREKEQLGRLLAQIASKMPILYPEKRNCFECGEWFDENEMTWVGGGRHAVCNKCRDSLYFECPGCDGFYHNDLGHGGADDALYCDSCWDERFCTCFKCDETLRRDDAITSPTGDLFCRSCFDEKFITCEHCDTAYVRDDCGGAEFDNEWWCQRCVDRNLRSCEHCDNYVLASDFRFHTDGWEGCESCYDEYCSDNPNVEENVLRGIEDHSYKPDPIYFRTKEEKRLQPRERAYIGFELEVESMSPGYDVNVGAKKAVDISSKFNGTPLFYCKYDGSLRNGFEVVSHPMTRKFMFSEREGGKAIISEMIQTLRRDGFRSWSTDTCGLHFHLSRKHFDGTFHLFKFLRFFYAMDRSFIVSVSGRKSENHMRQYCSLKDGNYSDQAKAIIEKSMPGYRSDNRYQAVNLCNRNTVEVRIFKGTLKEESFFRKAELMFAAIDFTKSAPAGYTMDDFFAWVNTNYKAYPHSFGWLTSKRLITAVKQEEEVACA